MDAQQRRERRQAKIKAGGASRLERITTTSSGNLKGYKEHKVPQFDETVPPVPSLSSVQNDSAAHDEDPVESVPDITSDDVVAKWASLSKDKSGETAGPGDIDPFARLMAELTNMSPGNTDAAGSFDSSGIPSFDSLASLQGMFGDAMGQDSAQAEVASTPSQAVWPLIHFVSNVVLIGFLALTGRSSILFSSFCALQIVLHSSRLLVERGRPPPTSMLGSLAQYLPKPFSTYVITGSRYYSILQSTITDFCLFMAIAMLVFDQGEVRRIAYEST